MIDTWDESLETGNELIDSQHKGLIGLIDKLADVEGRTGPDTFGLLDEVMDFTMYHFAAEEDLMREVGYPPAPSAEMLAQHREFKAYARLRVLEFRTGEMVSVLPLQSFLEEFLKVHEFGMDKVLADWIRQQGTAG